VAGKTASGVSLLGILLTPRIPQHYCRSSDLLFGFWLPGMTPAFGFLPMAMPKPKNALLENPQKSKCPGILISHRKSHGGKSHPDLTSEEYRK
jgi:hypothetical protein